jgi:hypothetical protein
MGLTSNTILSGPYGSLSVMWVGGDQQTQCIYSRGPHLTCGDPACRKRFTSSQRIAIAFRRVFGCSMHVNIVDELVWPDSV